MAWEDLESDLAEMFSDYRIEYEDVDTAGYRIRQGKRKHNPDVGRRTQYLRDYRARNKERVRQWIKAWEDRNRERRREQKRRYMTNHRARLKAKSTTAAKPDTT
jgi:hypothetical protein